MKIFKMIQTIFGTRVDIKKYKEQEGIVQLAPSQWYCMVESNWGYFITSDGTRVHVANINGDGEIRWYVNENSHAIPNEVRAVKFEFMVKFA